MEAVQKFYEEVIGFPLVATRCEKTNLFGKERSYMHCFFEIGEDECLAFYQFQDEDDHTKYSTGGFVFKAPPLRWGLDFAKDF